MNPPKRTAGRSSALRALGATLLLATAVSCSSVKIQSQRAASVTAPVAARHLMIVGMDERPEVRAQFEKQFKAQWKVASVECATSHQRFALADFGGDPETVRRKLAAAGVETVLVVRATDRNTGVEGRVRGSALAGALFAGELTMSNVDEARYRVLTSGGEITTLLTLRGRLFRVADGALLWSSITETKLGEDFDRDARLAEVAGAIAGQLLHDKIFN